MHHQHHHAVPPQMIPQNIVRFSLPFRFPIF
jgi:hypothetical protein